MTASTKRLYQAYTWGQYFFSRVMTATMEVLDDGRYRLAFRLNPEMKVSEALWTATSHMLVGLPLFLDLQPALVEKVPSSNPRERVFIVRTTKSATLWSRLGHAWASLRGEWTGLEFLLEQQRELMEQYSLLESANKKNLENVERLQAEMVRRVEVEERLRQAQKLEVVGKLAGGIAHDFNNLLTAIIGNLDLMLVQIPQGAPMRSFAEEALRAAESAGQLTLSLPAFSRKQPLNPQLLDVNSVVEKTVRLLRRTLPESIELLNVPSSTEGLCEVDATLLQNAILNLGINAQHALPDGGIIGVEVGEGRLEERDGKYVTINSLPAIFCTDWSQIGQAAQCSSRAVSHQPSGIGKARARRCHGPDGPSFSGKPVFS